MEGKEAITNKIIKDAENTARGVVGDAEAKADELISNAETYAEDYRNAHLDKLYDIKAEIISRRKTVAELDAKKLELGAKQQVIEKVFEAALFKLCSLPEKEYQSVIIGMLTACAEDGDIVTVKKSCKTMLPKVFFESYAKLNGIKLGYNTAGGDFAGGMILSGKGVDKNITFEVELELIREELLPQLAAKLFG